MGGLCRRRGGDRFREGRDDRRSRAWHGCSAPHSHRFFFVHNYGSPPESEWGGRGGVIAQIMHRVGVPEGSKALVRKVLEDVVAAQEEDEAYDASLGLSGSGRQAKITREIAEANVVYTAMGAGVGITETTAMVNEFRAEKDEDSDSVSWGAVKNSIHTCGVVRIHKRAQKKSHVRSLGLRRWPPLCHHTLMLTPHAPCYAPECANRAASLDVAGARYCCCQWGHGGPFSRSWGRGDVPDGLKLAKKNGQSA